MGKRVAAAGTRPPPSWRPGPRGSSTWHCTSFERAASSLACCSPVPFLSTFFREEGEDSVRPSTCVYLKLVVLGGGPASFLVGMVIKRLMIDFADDEAGLMWRRQTLETSDGRAGLQSYRKRMSAKATTSRPQKSCCSALRTSRGISPTSVLLGPSNDLVLGFIRSDN
jgi:hypothetical protein